MTLLQRDSEHQHRVAAPNDSESIYLGLMIAGLIITVWGLSLVYLLGLELSQMRFPVLALCVGWQTFLYTGLFVTAHDAMHGAICPNQPRINTSIGTLALLLYGFMPYQKLSRIHRLHHRYPASSLDPDFHTDQPSNVLHWYLNFLYSHGSGWSIGGLAVVYLLARCLVQIQDWNLILFWITPSLLSSFQLFFFGTFLPHREPPEGYTDAFRTKTHKRPFWWSLLSCYHFGYHYEHHRYPHAPWWQLPAINRRSGESP